VNGICGNCQISPQNTIALIMTHFKHAHGTLIVEMIQGVNTHTKLGDRGFKSYERLRELRMAPLYFAFTSFGI
jgi:hypothetical protein